MRTTILTLFALGATAWNLADYDAWQRSNNVDVAYEREDELVFEDAIEEPSLVTEDSQIIDAEDQNNFLDDDDDRVLIRAGRNKVYTSYPTSSIIPVGVEKKEE